MTRRTTLAMSIIVGVAITAVMVTLMHRPHSRTPISPLILLSVKPADQSRAAELEAHARDLYERGHFSDASNHFRRLARLAPDTLLDAEAERMRGQIQLRTSSLWQLSAPDHFEQSLAILDALPQKPDDNQFTAEVHLAHAVVLPQLLYTRWMDDQLNEAIAIAKRIVTVPNPAITDEQRARALLIAARIALQQNDQKAALRRLDRLLESSLIDTLDIETRMSARFDRLCVTFPRVFFYQKRWGIDPNWNHPHLRELLAEFIETPGAADTVARYEFGLLLADMHTEADEIDLARDVLATLDDEAHTHARELAKRATTPIERWKAERFAESAAGATRLAHAVYLLNHGSSPADFALGEAMLADLADDATAGVQAEIAAEFRDAPRCVVATIPTAPSTAP